MELEEFNIKGSNTMKKRIIYLMCIINHVAFTYSMDAPLQIYQSIEQKECKKKYDMSACLKKIIRHEHILFIPLRDISHSFMDLSLKKQSEIKNALINCPLFSIALLPKELCYKIVTEVLDGDEIIANKFFCMPIIQAYELYHELKERGPLNIGGREIPIHTLFSISQKERNRLYGISNPHLLDIVAGKSESIVDREDYEALVQIIPDEKENINLSILPSFCERLRLCCKFNCTKIFNMESFYSKFIGLFILHAFLYGGGKLLHDKGYSSFGNAFFISGAMVDAASLLMLIGYEAYLFRDFVMENATPAIASVTNTELIPSDMYGEEIINLHDSIED